MFSTARQRRLQIGLCLIVLGILGYMAIRRAVNGNADLSGNHRIWRVNLIHATQPSRLSETPSDPDSYPPITYAIYAPLGALPLWAAATVWYLLNLASSWGIVLELDQPWKIRGWSRFWQFLLAGMVFSAWVGTILLGQNTLFLIWMILRGWRFAETQHPWKAGLCWALAALLKVLPVVFLLLWLTRRRWNCLISFALSLFLMVGAGGSLYFGPHTNWVFHQRWLHLAMHGPIQAAPSPLVPETMRGSMRYGNQATEVVLARLLLPVPITNRGDAPRVNLVDVGVESWRRIRAFVQVLLASSILGTLVFLVFHQTRTDGQSSGSILEISLLCPLLLLLSPIVWAHYYLWLLPVFCPLLERCQQRDRIALCVMGMWLVSQLLLVSPIARACGAQWLATLCLQVWIARHALKDGLCLKSA